MTNILKEVYSLIANVTHASGLRSELNLNLMKLMEASEMESEKQIIRWEIDCLDFYLMDGRAEGLGAIDEQSAAYLDERLQSDAPPEAKARYAQILWNHPTQKHIKYLEAAVDAYFLWLLPKNFSECLSDYFEAVFNLLHLSISNSYRKEEAKTFLIHLISLQSDEAHFRKPRLIEFGVDKRLFNNDYLLSVHSDLIQITAYFREKHDLHNANAIAEAGKKIAAKLQMDIKPWLLELGNNHEAFAHRRKDDVNGMIPTDSLREAIRYYNQAKSGADITRATLLYQQFREKVNLDEFSVDLPLDQAQILQDSEDEIVTWYLSHSASEILVHLALDHRLIPSIESIKQAEEADTDNSFLRLIRTLSFDRNGNVSEKDEGSSILDSYGMHLGFLTVPLLRRILVDGLRTGKVTVEQWLEYFSLHTWLGISLERNRHGGVISRYNWISLLAPGLHEFFFQLETSEKPQRPFLNLVQPLDSLTLKAEGLIRDIVLLSGGTTATTSKNGDMLEKPLEQVLNEESLKKPFTEDELHFFKYVLTREGLNLRNDIAHGFLRFQDYTLDKMLLILLVIIRLSKFSIPNTP